MAIAWRPFHNAAMNASAPRRGLYPPVESNSSGFLDVGAGHQLYYEESGNPSGKPVVVLHGGPGAGTTPDMRRFFNPSVYRIVLFDQRGSGKSTPHASLADNTTWDLVNDIEILRAALAVERWQVFVLGKDIADECEPQDVDLRTAALVTAIERVADATLMRGIWP